MPSLQKKIMPFTVYLCFALFCLALMNTDVYSQKREYPERPIEIIAGTPGSPGDLWIRAWDKEFSKLLKAPLVVVNKGGALSLLVQLSMAKPDGYTLCYLSYAQMIAWAMTAKPPFDFFKDFVPIGTFGTHAPLIAVEKSSPFKTFDDLIDYAKKNPKKLKCGTPGLHMIDNFVLEMLMEQTKTDMVSVPFTGSAQVVTALLGKHVDMIVNAPAALVGHMKAGTIRPLLTILKLKEFPNIPLFSEKGLGEAGIINIAGIIARSAVPKEIQNKLVDSIEKIAKDPQNVEKIEQLAFTANYAGPAEMWSRLKKDYDRIDPIVRRLGIKE